MSYAASPGLQEAVFALLSGALAGEGVPVLDAAPPAGVDTFVLLGPEEVRDASDASGAGAEHRLLVSVIGGASGFAAAKRIAALVSDTLAGAEPALSRGRVVGIAFERARALRRDGGTLRRIDLTFRARVEL